MSLKRTEELVMRFDPKTIEHLGIQMYATLPPVIAELISNAYDADAKNVRIDLNDQGEKTIIILPGWGDTRKTFTYLIEQLKENFTIYIMDYPGFGNSPFPNHNLTIYDYTNIIRDFINEKQIKKPIIIAHSFGGRIAILLAGYYKEEIEKLILMDTAGIKRRKSLFLWVKEKIYKLLKQIKKILPKKMKEIYHSKLLNIFGSSDYKALPKEMYETFKQVIKEDLKYYLPYIEPETLILWGEKDKSTPLKDGKLLNQKIKNSALITYPEATHYSYLEYPLLTYNIIEKFLNENRNC